MRSTLLTAGALALLLVFLGPLRAEPAGTSVETCARHLPAGYRYVFDISGVIDTRGEAPGFQGDISVKARDEAGVDGEKIGQFVDCVTALLR